uniref:Galectin n=1 Tax=Ditylenchus dipsaci TaxID=166011 RepID=A0A915EIB0_9BILA
MELAGSDIALHFNPRFRHFSEHTIVLNTSRHGDWQTEERHKNKLSIGDTFCLRISLHHNHFLVELNDRHICHYQHRIPPNKITHLEIEGDVSVQRVKLINCEKYAYSTPAPVPTHRYAVSSTHVSSCTTCLHYSPAPTAYPPAPPPTYGIRCPFRAIPM